MRPTNGCRKRLQQEKSCRFQSTEQLFTIWDRPRRGKEDRSVPQDRQPRAEWIKYAPQLLDLGLLGMIGKGRRSSAVKEAVVRNGAVYFAAVGGAGALLSKSIREAEVVAYEDLGTEAIRKLTVEEFPVIVCMDSEGTDLYETAAEKYREEFV